MTQGQANDQIRLNIKAHDKVAAKYEKLHGEIYNPLEQARLHEKLGIARSSLRTDAPRKTALDFGCGAGNLTRHLLELGFGVTASDVSPRFLELVRKDFSDRGSLDTFHLNGSDLAGIPDDSFDLAATYSVLHHVPDYLGAVAEMARVVKPGGILYLDHEVNEGYWSRSEAYREFLGKVRPNPGWTRFFDPNTYYLKIRSRLNPKFRDEGDIHVFQDDHIEWGKIETLLGARGFEIVLREDYLIYRREYARDIYDAYKDRCTDMRLLIARKRTG